MSFSYSSTTLRSANLHFKLSVNAENVTNASEPYNSEETNANEDWISPELIEERIRANLEPLNKQILTLT